MTILLRKNKIILGKNKNMYLLLFPQTKVSQEIKWELGVIKIESVWCGTAICNGIHAMRTEGRTASK